MQCAKRSHFVTADLSNQPRSRLLIRSNFPREQTPPPSSATSGRIGTYNGIMVPLCSHYYAIYVMRLSTRPSPFAALNDALRRFMSLANNLPVTDRVFAWGGERPLIDAATIPPNASIRAAVYGPFCHAIALNPINFCECVKWILF